MSEEFKVGDYVKRTGNINSFVKHIKNCYGIEIKVSDIFKIIKVNDAINITISTIEGGYIHTWAKCFFTKVVRFKRIKINNEYYV